MHHTRRNFLTANLLYFPPCLCSRMAERRIRNTLTSYPLRLEQSWGYNLSLSLSLGAQFWRPFRHIYKDFLSSCCCFQFGMCTYPIVSIFMQLISPLMFGEPGSGWGRLRARESREETTGLTALSKPNSAEMGWSCTSRAVAARVRGSSKSIRHHTPRPHLITPRCKPSGLAGSNLRSMLEYITLSAMEGVLTRDSGVPRLQWPSWFSVCYSPP